MYHHCLYLWKCRFLSMPLFFNASSAVWNPLCSMYDVHINLHSQRTTRLSICRTMLICSWDAAYFPILVLFSGIEPEYLALNKWGDKNKNQSVQIKIHRYPYTFYQCVGSQRTFEIYYGLNICAPSASISYVEDVAPVLLDCIWGESVTG